MSNQFSQFNNVDELLKFLNLSEAQYDSIIKSTYKTFPISKKRGGTRLINAPSASLLLMQKKLKTAFSIAYNSVKSNNAYGYIDKVQHDGELIIKQHAEVHLGAKWMVNLDLEDFFYTIKVNHIEQVFLRTPFNFSEQLCKALIPLLTNDGRIPIGAPTSPVLSNFVLLDLDIELQELASLVGAKYTRYADDISFSFMQSPKNEFIPTVIAIVSKYGFKVNYKKVNLRNHNQRLVVTGLTINEKINASQRYFKELRAILFNLANRDFKVECEKYIRKNFSAYKRFMQNVSNAYYAKRYGQNIYSHYKNFETPNLRTNFLYLSLKGRVCFVEKVLGKISQRVQKLWDLFENVFSLHRKEEVEPQVSLVYITNATANAVIRYAYYFLKLNKVTNGEMRVMIKKFSNSKGISWEKIKNDFKSQSIYFLHLYKSFYDNGRFEHLFRTYNEEELKRVVKYWNGYDDFFQRFYRRSVFHLSPHCSSIRNPYNEPDGYHDNTGVFVHNQNNSSKTEDYFVNREFLEQLGMNLCFLCECSK